METVAAGGSARVDPPRSRAGVGWFVRRLRIMSAAELWQRIVLLTKQIGWVLGIRTTATRPLNQERCRSLAAALHDRWGTAPLPARVMGTPFDAGDPTPLAARDYDVRGMSGFGPWINWRGDEHGDIREFWERCRLQWMTALVRQAENPAAELENVLDRFLSAHPPLRGPAWATGLEGAVRAVSVALAAGQLRGAPGGPAADRCLGACRALIVLQSSPGSSANNHALGEAAALAVIDYATGVSDTELGRSLRRAASVFVDQTYPDGSGREAATDYWRFNLDWARLIDAVATLSHHRLPTLFTDRLERAETVVGGSGLGRMPGLILGDTDDARAWPVGEPPPVTVSDPPTVSLEAGLALATFQGPTRFDVALRSGPFGFPATGAHSHDDQLAIYLAVNGNPLVVDPGSDRYFGDSVRDDLRAGSSHATFRVFGHSTARRAGRFLWSDITSGVPVEWEGHRLSAAWRKGSLCLKRDVEWRGTDDRIDIVDTVTGNEGHTTTWSWPFAPDVDVVRTSENTWVLRTGHGSFLLTTSMRPTAAREVTAWVSPSYGIREQATRLEADWSGEGVVEWSVKSFNGVER